MPSLYTERDWERPHSEALPSDALEPEPYRSEPWRDYARLLHSPSFRRLDGKTQLFPGSESDFFRNRLTHTLEVAQIAKSVAKRINHLHSEELGGEIDLDLIEFAAHAHDLGHPPFGHVGEEALDECMYRHGGFEGNAQTLRILSTLEKKIKGTAHSSGIDDDESDLRHGLNVTYRALASVLKYDREIPYSRSRWCGVEKGYFHTDAHLIRDVKSAVAGDAEVSHFKTIECSIMDLADDIAYSTYDLEDAFKAGFLQPMDLMAADQAVIEDVAQRVSSDDERSTCNSDDARETLYGIFQDFLITEDLRPEDFSNDIPPSTDDLEQDDLEQDDLEQDDLEQDDLEEDVPEESSSASRKEGALAIGSIMHRNAKQVAASSYRRTGFTSRLVGSFIRDVEFKLNAEHPALSRVHLKPETHRKVEVLKHYTFVSQIESSRLKLVEYRGKEIVRKIFETLRESDGHRLLPPDFQMLYDRVPRGDRARVVCDFVAGMTDRYALEYYSRIVSEDPETIFKPL